MYIKLKLKAKVEKEILSILDLRKIETKKRNFY